MVKITGGRFKGRNINSVKANELRPTTSFFREWLFNVLNNMIELDEVRLLDLFAGTGIITFEFMSRGALSSVAVEKDRNLVSLIKSNSLSLSLNTLDIVQSECSVFLTRLAAKNELSRFNVIFMDAPYEKTSLTDEALSIICSNIDSFVEDIVIIVETDKDKVLKIEDNFVILKSKSSGTTKMSVIGRAH